MPRRAPRRAPRARPVRSIRWATSVPPPPTRPPKPAGWTTLSGRGAAHQKERDRLLAALVEGTPCPFGEGFCGHAPMYSWQELDCDEWPPRALANGGPQVRRLSHASCNRRAGAILGNQLRKGRPRPPRQQANTPRRSRW